MTKEQADEAMDAALLDWKNNKYSFETPEGQDLMKNNACSLMCIACEIDLDDIYPILLGPMNLTLQEKYNKALQLAALSHPVTPGERRRCWWCPEQHLVIVVESTNEKRNWRFQDYPIITSYKEETLNTK